MTAETAPAGSASASRRAFTLPLVLRIALRDLRLGWSGFAVFVACIALGVAAIAGVGSLAGALQTGLARQGQAILGGDVSLRLVHRQASTEERAFLEDRGSVSEIATLRAMARPAGGERTALAHIKAVDAAYPLYGAAKLSGPGGGSADLSELRESGTAAVEPILLERLGMETGDTLRIGESDVRIVATIAEEPDRLSGRAAIGLRILMSHETLRATGLIQPGSLIRWTYRVRLPQGDTAGPAQLREFRQQVEKSLPDAGFVIRDRRNPAPAVRRIMERLSQFLTLVGVTTLMIGGIGVANAIAAYLVRKRTVIAAFKCLGARGAAVFRIYLLEALVLAAAGTAIGLVAGALLPAAVAGLGAGALPVRLALAPQPFALVLATAYGVLTTLMFVFWPLGQARDLPATLLMRQSVSQEATRPRAVYIAASAVCALALAGIAILSSQHKLLAALACAGLAGGFALFLGLGIAIERATRAMPRPKRPALALARASLARPGGLARPVALSLGASLTLLAAVALVNTSLIKEFETHLPAEAPSYFVLDVGREQMAPFKELVLKHEPQTEIEQAPMLRGRIVRLNGTPASEIKPAPGTEWVLNGDRGLTYSETLPEGSDLTGGEWWPADYDGPPLVSFEAEIAEGLGLKIGDTVTVNVLGRNLQAEIANLREVDWDSLAINFVMVFSPNALEGAPHNLLATLNLPAGASAELEGKLVQEMTEAFPNVTALRVRDAINAFRAIAERVMAAVRAAGGVTLLAGAIVLAGALATAQRRRIRDTVIFKTLGATRRRILAAHLAEYSALALITGVVASGLGTLGAYLVVTLAMDSTFTFSILAILQAVGLAAGLVLAFGAAATWRILGANAAEQLRRA